MIRDVTKINISDKEPARITPLLLLQFQHCTFSEVYSDIHRKVYLARIARLE